MNKLKSEDKEIVKSVKVFTYAGTAFIVVGLLGVLITAFLGLRNSMDSVLIMLVGGLIISGISKVLFHISIILNKLNDQTINEGEET